MPVEKTIGSQGLEQGGANLGNDYSRPSGHTEQNETTNVGSHGTADNDKNENKEGAIPDKVKTVQHNTQGR